MPNQPKLSITIGADPELFLKNKKTGQLVSAHDLIPGTKNQPFKVPFGAIQVDGVAAEFNIDPCDNWADFIQCNEAVLKNLRDRLPDCELVFEPTATFDPDYFNSLPFEVKELGCNPDWNAWTGQLNPSPDGDSTTMRTASGHIHIGWTQNADITSEDHVHDCQLIVRNLDYYLGLQSMRWDFDNKRRQLYGKAGSHRRKPYGVEYRTLSNKWLTNISLQKYVFEATQRCMSDIIQKGVDLEEQFQNTAQVIIDNNIKWWDANELDKHKDLLPEGVGVFNVVMFNSNHGIPKPPELEEPKKIVKATKAMKTKKNPFHKYNKDKNVFDIESFSNNIHEEMVQALNAGVGQQNG